MDMTKILDELVINKWTKALRAVEQCMDDNKVQLEYMGGNNTLVTIHGRRFKMKTTEFPRYIEEDHLYVEE